MSVMIRIDSFGGIDIGAARHVLLEDVVLDRPADLVRLDARFSRPRRCTCEQDGGRGVDRHRGRDLVRAGSVEEDLHVGQGIDGDADLADFAVGHGRIGVVAHLGRQVEGDREAGLPGAEEVVVALVGFLGRAEAGILAHGPEPAAVHGRLHAAGIGVLAGEAELLRIAGLFETGGEAALHFQPGGGTEFLFAFGALVDHFFQGRIFPAFFFVLEHSSKDSSGG